MNLKNIEIELKKRCDYPYIWGRKQNNYWDDLTSFIYKIDIFDELLKTIEIRFKQIKNKEISEKDFFNYALNRWYNFHSAVAIEKIICTVDGITPALNSKDRLVDFKINGINFDHKTSVFPKGFNKNIDYAMKNKTKLIQWLYLNQSQQQRKHLENRLFIIVYSSDNKGHWKLKSELTWLKNIVLNYAQNFDANKLIKLTMKTDNTKTLSDIIWAIK